MYMPACRCKNGLNGLGANDLVKAAIPIAAAYFGGPAGGAAAAGAMSSDGTGGSGDSGGTAPGVVATVSPTITTQISPQISPVFQQQFQPTNSAATAGTSQALPSMPGTLPNGGVGVPGYSPAAPVPSVPQIPVDWTKYMPYALAGLGIVAFVSLKKRGTRKA